MTAETWNAGRDLAKIAAKANPQLSPGEAWDSYIDSEAGIKALWNATPSDLVNAQRNFVHAFESAKEAK